MKKERIGLIDDMRGFAIFFVILIHSLAYYLYQPRLFFLWNSLHFAVPLFIFCSSYLFFKNESRKSNFVSLRYIFKRLKRLLIPYYLFCASYVLLVFLTRPNQINGTYLIANVLVLGGIDINWLVLLFLIFSLLVSFFSYFLRHNQAILWVYSFIALASSIVLLFYKPNVNYKLYFWLPWSLLIILTYIMIRIRTNAGKLLTIGTVLFLVWFILRKILLHFHQTLTFYNNEYPPNLYFLSFGSFSIIFCYLIASKLAPILAIIRPILQFLSQNSYSLFFIHALVIYNLDFHWMQGKITWISFFLTVLIYSIIIQLTLNVVMSMFNSIRSPK